jgi:hypothetical protein
VLCTAVNVWNKINASYVLCTVFTIWHKFRSQGGITDTSTSPEPEFLNF